MGYYTAFNVYVRCDNKDAAALTDRLCDMGFNVCSAPPSEEEPEKVQLVGDLYTSNSSWDDEFRAISAEFPSAFIELSGDGDDHDDLWKAYFQNGLMQFAPGEIVYDEFDPAKLKGKENAS